MPEFGDRIRYFLSERGLSQADLARRLDTSPQNVTSILNQKKPRVDTIEKVASALGVETYELLSEGYQIKKLLDDDEWGGGTSSRHEGIPFWDMDVVGQAASFEKVITSTQPTYYLDAPDFNGCYAFRANTDTMEGVIRTGSIIFATKIQDWVSHLEYGQIYLIICNDGRKYLRYIKRFKENPKEYFFLQSENKFYDEFELPKAAIDSIWLIHGHLSKRI